MSLLKHAELTFQIHCYYDGAAPRYRVYVDSDLITERTFVWDTRDQFIEEHVVIEAPVGPHTLRIENVDPALGTFTVEHLLVDGIPTDGNSVFNIT
jgi:hypothetical protein